MDWDDLRTFLAIARHGTLSAAARALGVTQPTMGRRLTAMESRTGARLLQRLPGGYALTPLGETVLGNAERVEAEVLAAERTITGKDVAIEGLVRLTTVDTPRRSSPCKPSIRASLSNWFPTRVRSACPSGRPISRCACLASRGTRW